jgi:hypothetical protein
MGQTISFSGGHFDLDDIVEAGFQRPRYGSGGLLLIVTKDGEEHLTHLDLRDGGDFRGYLILKERFPEQFERRVT